MKTYYRFSYKQTIKITLKQIQTIMRGQCHLGQIFGGHLKLKRVFLFDEQLVKRAKIFISAQFIVEWYKKNLVMDWKAVDIPNVSSKFLSHSSPYLKFLRINLEDETYTEVGQTEVIKKSATPNWKKIKFPLETLIDPKNPLPSFQVQCWHKEEKDKHEDKLIGEARVQLQKLKGVSEQDAEIFRIEDKQSTKKKGAGKLVMTDKQYQDPDTFLSITKQLKLLFAVGINIKSYINLQQKIQCTGTLIEKIWDLIEPFTGKQQNYINAFNIGANLNQNIQPTAHQNYNQQKQKQRQKQKDREYEIPKKKSSYEENKSVELATQPSDQGSTKNQNKQRKLKQKNLSISNPMLFNNQQKYLNTKHLMEHVKQYYKSINPKNQSSEPSSLYPYIEQLNQLHSTSSSQNFYKLFIIITDSQFSDLEQSIIEMMVGQYPASFFFLQIGNEVDLSDFDIFNKKYLINTTGQYQSIRPLSRFMRFNSNLENIDQFIGQFLEPIQEHITYYAEHVINRFSNSQENQQLIMDTEKARSSNTNNKNEE